MPRRPASTLGVPQPFPETNWSLIQLCQDPGDPGARASLDHLFRRYWSPVYFHVVRYWTRDPEEARDLTQAFFVSFLERDFLRSVEAGRGRFRTFVCVALRHFLSNEKRNRKAKKRDPGQGILSIEGLRERDSRFDIPDEGEPDHEAQFTKDWKKAVIQAALERLRRVAEAKGKTALVEAMVQLDLEPPAGGKPSYGEISRRTGLSTSQVTNGLHWARVEFVRCLKDEIRDLVASDEEGKAEAMELFGIGD